jgi:hypothetical protein
MAYTEAQLKEAARKAYAAGDTAAAKRFIAAARKAASAAPVDQGQAMRDRIAAAKSGTLQMQPGSAERAAAANEEAAAMMQPERTVGQTVYENVIGSGAVDTPFERLGELIRGAGAATARGIADVPAIPANLAQLGAMGVEKALGMEQPSLVSRGLAALPETREMLAAVPVIGPESRYVAPGLLGKYISTGGEFAGGAGALAGPRAMLRYGVIPGVASEAAGQATEGTAVEPYARVVAPIIASLLAGRPGAFAGDDEAARMANVVERAGVRGVSAGQASGSQPLMRMEGMLQATDKQLEDFTAATLKMLGSDKKVATPANLMNIEKTLVDQMDSAVSGVSVVPSAANSASAIDVAKNYIERVPAGQLTPRVRGIASEINASSKAGKPVSLSQLKEWRSDIGRLTISPDAATREAAHSLRSLLDEMTDDALIAAGRESDIAALAKARESYRNYIGVRDAASRSESGILSPQALNQSMIRAQGRESYATGRSTPMTDFTRSAAATLRPAPTVSPGGVRSISEALPAALGAAGAGAAVGAGLGPLAAIAGGVGGALAPAVGQIAMRSAPVQAMLRDPKGTLARLSRLAPGLLGQ